MKENLKLDSYKTGFWDKFNKILPLSVLVALLLFILTQVMTINKLEIKIGQLENGDKNDSAFIDKSSPENDSSDKTRQGILDLVDREKRLAGDANYEELKEVYTEDAEYIKKVGGNTYSSTGYEEIFKRYNEPDLKIDESNKYNFRIYYTKFGLNQKPVEANLLYDVFIKYSYKNVEKYELKNGKELMKLVYDADKGVWRIKYFYIESA
ncbi:MAG TPA: hypothetical protein VHT34_05105 [Clostridia bacterium]|nr:hypothetical protein [Clostridia bacterium]